MKKFLFSILVSVFFLSACGPEAEPTMSAEDVQGTAEAAAWTMVAETQAAIPTATPIPPTETPSPTPVLPTNTVAPLVSPTQPLVVQPTNTPASSANECDKVMAASPDGPHTTLLISNETKAPITITIGLLKTPFGECGYRSYSITKNNSTRVDVPQGCYWAYAWVNDSKNPTTVQGGGYCMNNSDKWTMIVRKGQIILNPP
jgi:hypothetical protein